MNNQLVLPPILSFPDILRSREPRVVFEERLVALLVVRLRTAGIVWSPKAFRGGLTNPELPVRLLKKLESLLSLAEAVGWKLSKTALEELDGAIEDIETFNPNFRTSLKRASDDIKAGKFITQAELEKRYRFTHT